MYKQFAFFSLCLLLYGSPVQGYGNSPSKKMKENLGEWTMELRNSLKELEQQIEGLQNKGQIDVYDNLKKNLWNFYDLIKNKTLVRILESDDQNQMKWIKLAQEYDIKFRHEILYPLSNSSQSEIQHIPKEILEMSLRLIRGFGADLNTFLAQIDLLSLEDELEQYTERVEKLDRGQEWRKMMRGLEKVMESEKIDHHMIGKLKNDYEQSEANKEYRKNIEEMLDKMEKIVSKILKEIVEYGTEIYLTEQPFEDAENRLILLENDQKSMIEMSDLRGIMDKLIVETKLVILRNELNIKFESVNKAIQKQSLHNQSPDWRAFKALADAFDFDWKEMDRKSRDLSVDDQTGIREQLEQIKKAAQIKAKPLKPILIDQLKGIDEARADLELIRADLTSTNRPQLIPSIAPKNPEWIVEALADSDRIAQNRLDLAKFRDQFWDRAIGLCDKLDKIEQRIHVSYRYKGQSYASEIGTKMKQRKLTNSPVPEKFEKPGFSGTLHNYGENFGKIEEMILTFERMKTGFENAFGGDQQKENGIE